VLRQQVPAVLERDVAQLVVRVFERARRHLEDLVHALVEQRAEDVVLALEVPVDRRAGEPRAAPDVIHAHGREPPFAEELGCRAENGCITGHTGNPSPGVNS